MANVLKKIPSASFTMLSIWLPYVLYFVILITQVSCFHHVNGVEAQNESITSKDAFQLLDPISIDNNTPIYRGFVFKDNSQTLSIQSKKFGGNYYLSERKDGGDRILFYAPWYEQASKLVGKELLMKGEKRTSKIGMYLLVDSFEILNE